MRESVYYAVKNGYPVGPYDSDEVHAQAHAGYMLGYGKGVKVYRITAKSFEDARSKASKV